MASSQILGAPRRRRCRRPSSSFEQPRAALERVLLQRIPVAVTFTPDVDEGPEPQDVAPIVEAISTYLHSAFANRICLGVRHSGSKMCGEAIRKTAHLAREVA